MGIFDIFGKNKKAEQAETPQMRMKRFSEKVVTDIINCCSSYDSSVSDGVIHLSKLDVTIRPMIYELKDRVVTLGFKVASPQWDREIFEICSGLGSDTNAALGMAQGSFMFALMDAVTRLNTNDHPEEFESEFAGNKHKWKLYIGNILGVGGKDENTDLDAKIYWNVLKEHIAKRLGNQKMCYVKIFASNSGRGDAIGEVRINNLKSEELSKNVEDIAAKWTNTEFKSHKQFFMFKQEEETTLPYPYTEADIIRKTKWAMKIFELCLQEDKVEAYGEVLYSETKDDNLSAEFYRFIPEICAESAIELAYPETLDLGIGDKTSTCYKTQLYSYSIIHDTIFDTLEGSELDDPKNVRASYICSSAIGSLASQMIEKGYKLEQLKDLQFSITYSMGKDYILR